VKVITRWKGKGANRKATEKKVAVRAWWTSMLNGVSMRLRFIPGRQGVVVGSIAELPGAIDELVEQIKSGELDQMITPKPKAKPLHVPVDVKKLGKAPAGKRRAA
jgi:hypothetical protein